MTHRRTFLKNLAVSAGALSVSDLMAQTTPDWKKQMGLELYTVRDILPKDYEGTLAKVAEIGYKEVEAADPYNNMEPKQYRALLDRYGLTMPSTHSGAVDGPDLEKQLEGFQIMGLKYTEVRGGGGGAARRRGRRADAARRRPAARPVESAKRSGRRAQQLRRDHEEVRDEDAGPQSLRRVRAPGRRQADAIRRPARRDESRSGRDAARYRLGLRRRPEHSRDVREDTPAGSSSGT